MNRRNWYRGCIAAILKVITGKPRMPGFPWTAFNPTQQYGYFLMYEHRSEMDSMCNEVIDQLHNVVPDEYYHINKVQWVHLPPKLDPADPLSQRGFIGWKYRYVDE